MWRRSKLKLLGSGGLLLAQLLCCASLSVAATPRNLPLERPVSNSDLTDLFAQTPVPPVTPAPQPPVIPTPVVPPPPAPPVTVAPETAPLAPPALITPETPLVPPVEATEDEAVNDDISVGEIPAVETTELSVDLAKRAIDVYVVVKEKYKEADIEQYDNLQDFVEQNPSGKQFEADVKAAGFTSVNDWNLAITTASFTYTNIIDDQTDDIKQQIEELKQDQEMAQDMRDRMISSLNSMIPSENNRKIVEELMKDPVYADKVKSLQVEEE
jgi:hypothetical protein